MIVESIIGGITTITCSSLWLVNVLDKRKRLADEKVLAEIEAKIEAELYPPVPKPPPIILPFQILGEKQHCPICGVRNSDIRYGGPQLPQVCKVKCSATDNGIPHLHCRCLSCDSKWLMAPKTSTEETTV
jgi:hypothetical protein